jgi:hypothetical protein
MISGEDDILQIAPLHGEELDSWLNERPSAFLQWWAGVLESVELRTHVARGESAEVRREMYNAGARLLIAGAARGEIPSWYRAYWQLRFAAGASSETFSGLDEVLTPDGAVRWTLDNMPLSRDETIRYREERDILLNEADQFQVQLTSDHPESWREPPVNIAVLQGVEKVLSALKWIDLSRLDERLRVEVEPWLHIR